MTIQELQKRILAVKREKNVAVLAHSYQSRAVTEVADVVGDSFALSAKAAELDTPNVLMCGVRFMAETVKILSPGKRVYLSEVNAGCPMAEQLDTALLARIKNTLPNHTFVAYINTTAELKTQVDVCVTSSSAVKIVNALPNENIAFIPDANLGDYVRGQCPGKNVWTFSGGCPVHIRLTIEELNAAKAQHPNAQVLAHPECGKDIQQVADFIGSTSEIMAFARKSRHTEFIIATEIHIVEHLQYDCADDEPYKFFYPASKDLICPNMQLTTPGTILDALNSIGSADNPREILLDDDTIAKARRSIDRMLELG
ncbi:quinolinate synthase A [Clostridia bacterium]|nr:quinolinate synthase A [Clostridia bacterium]